MLLISLSPSAGGVSHRRCAVACFFFYHVFLWGMCLQLFFFAFASLFWRCVPGIYLCFFVVIYRDHRDFTLGCIGPYIYCRSRADGGKDVCIMTSRAKWPLGGRRQSRTVRGYPTYARNASTCCFDVDHRPQKFACLFVYAPSLSQGTKCFCSISAPAMLEVCLY